ncbi:MAG: hypothetical protein QNK23_08510 [Crocinitomicaceae bacterium]|nr:hypothetical protein [Crocinitomicaceae bacterium]
MNRVLILFSLLISFSLQAQDSQIILSARCYDPVTLKEIRGISMKFRNQYADDRAIWYLDSLPPGDTLFLDHDLYQFHQVPISHYDFKLKGNRIELQIVAVYKAQDVIYIKVPIAKNAETKNTDVSISVCTEQPEAVLEVNGQEPYSTWESNGISLFKTYIPYDEIHHTSLRLDSYTGIIEHQLIESMEWTQIIPMDAYNHWHWSDREIDLLHEHFRSLQNIRDEKKRAIEKSQEWINELRDENKSLHDSIKVLNGIEEEVVIELIEEEPILEEEIIDFPTIKAKPILGWEEFEREITRKLEKLSSIYSGNITVQLHIDPYGRVVLKKLHEADINPELFDSIKAIRFVNWIPREERGKRSPCDIVISIDIVKK